VVYIISASRRDGLDASLAERAGRSSDPLHRSERCVGVGSRGAITQSLRQRLDDLGTDGVLDSLSGLFGGLQYRGKTGVIFNGVAVRSVDSKISLSRCAPQESVVGQGCRVERRDRSAAMWGTPDVLPTSRNGSP
jgi:hypothetical protein